MCCSITQLSANFISTSANAIGRSFRGHGCGICCPGSGFLGPQSSGAIVAAVHSFAVQCHCPGPGAIHSRNTAGHPSALPVAAMSALRQPRGPGSAASTTLLAIRFTNFAGGGVSFAAACLTAAHCILSAKSRVRQYQQQPMSVPQQRFACSAARTLVCRICKAVRMLHESILSGARIVSAFSVVLGCRVCVPSPRASTSKDSKSRTYIRKSSVHAPVSANVARLRAKLGA